MKPLLHSCALILAVLLLSAPSLSAEEKPSAKPVKSKPSPSIGKKQQAKPHRQATDTQSAPPQTAQPVSEPKPDPKKETSDQQPQRASESGINWSGWAQVIVGAFGLWFIWRTLKAVERQADANRITANAALEEAKAITLSEQAYVFAKVELQVGTPLTDHQGMTRINASALFINHGKTPAVIINMTGGLYVRGAGVSDVPQEFPDTPNDDRQFSEGWVIANEGTFQLPLRIIIPGSEMAEIGTSAKVLYGLGWIKYKDILGNKRETGYCWEYLGTQRGFKFCYASPLNYTEGNKPKHLQ